MSIEAMKQALETLEESVDLVRHEYTTDWRHGMPTRKAQLDGIKRGVEAHEQAITSLRQAIAEAEKQEQGEPFEYWNAVEGWVKLDEVREHFDSVSCGTIYKNGGEGRVPLYTHPQPKQPLMLEKFREMKALLDDDIHTHKKMFTDDELKIIMETTMPEIDWKARHGVELNNGERNKWMLEWFIAFARAIETAHGIKE